jgi:cell division protein ZipA
MTEFFAEFGLRDWLLMLGPIFIAGVLIHGYWRMRTNRNTLKMSLDKSFVSDVNDGALGAEKADELTMLRAELPNGGARVLMSEQTSLNLEESVPVLMDPVIEGPREKPRAESIEEIRDEFFEDELTPVVTEVEAEIEPEAQSTKAQAPLPKDLPEKYMVINVMSIGEPFKGQELLECLVNQEMSIGEMDIFHRTRQGQELFSLMNAVEPGSFDLNQIAKVETPAVSMFMRVHELRKPTQVFQEMLDVAESIAEQLGGEVRDETRSVMTSQTIEHCRLELAEYELKNHT